MTLFRAIESDLKRNYQVEVSESVTPTRLKLLGRLFSPRLAPVLLIRLSQAAYRSQIRPVAKLFAMLNYICFGIEVGLKGEIGPGLYLPHTVGTVLGAFRIGANAMIFQGVTLGASQLDISFTPALRPTLEDNVTVGAGAKVLGAITIGQGATVGANAVVVSNVLPATVVGGIPARPLDNRE
jgi:serine O-acetyltransferase